jgi:hypothetical protein
MLVRPERGAPGKTLTPEEFKRFKELLQDDIQPAAGQTLSPEDRRLIEMYRPGRPGRPPLANGDSGALERAVRKLDSKSALAQSFGKDKATCGACH